MTDAEAIGAMDVSSPNCLLACLREVFQPLPQSQLERLVEEIFPEVRQINAARSPEQRAILWHELVLRLQAEKNQDEYPSARL